mgnify:CR=1 FL=1
MPSVPSMSRRPTIALIGMRCAGKSVTGRALAAQLGLPFLDLDLELLGVARRAGERAASAGELERTREAWRRAADRTPHGSPIELRPTDYPT